MLRFLSPVVFLLFASTLTAQTARVQIIHNAPQPSVDIYANNQLLLDNFQFRSATAFMDLPAGVNIDVAVAPASSSSAADAIATFPVSFEANQKYVVMAAGIVGGNPGFNLFVNPVAQETAVIPDNVDISVFHGSPDAPAVDIYEFYLPGKLVTNLSFGNFTDYLSVKPGIYDLQIEQAGSLSTFAPVFRADLNGLAGSAATVFASGLYTSNNPAFGLFAALPNGTVIPLPATPMAEVQVIHNAPSPTVDIYLNDTRKIENFQFRNVQDFTNLPANRPLRLSIAPGTSSSVAEAIANFDYNLAENTAYVIIAAGVLGNSGNTAFNLFVKQNALTSSNSAGNVSIQVFHGSPDAPEVDVILPNGTVLVDNLSFGEFSSYITVPVADYTFYITPSNDNSTIVGAYLLDKDQPLPINGRALTFFASGFLNQTPAFELWTTGALTFPLTQVTSQSETPDFATGIKLWPNPADERIFINLNLEKAADLRYRVLDYSGKLMMEGNWGQLSEGSFTDEIETSTLPAGMYNLQILSEKETQTLRFARN